MQARANRGRGNGENGLLSHWTHPLPSIFHKKNFIWACPKPEETIAQFKNRFKGKTLQVRFSTLFSSRLFSQQIICKQQMANLLVQVITRTCANKTLQMKPGLHLAHRENLLPFCPGLLTLSLFLSFHDTSKFQEEHKKEKRKKKKKFFLYTSFFCKFRPKYSSQKEFSTHLFSFFPSSFPRLLL